MKKSWPALLLSIVLVMGAVLSGCSSDSPNRSGSRSADNDAEGGSQHNAENSQDGDGSNAAAAGKKYGGVLRIITTQDVQNIGDPVAIRSISDNMISGTALETLGRYDENGDLRPFLAESWDLDPDAKTITIKLRRGIQFHDGTDFDAEAVRWNLETFSLAKKPQFNETDTKSVETLDDYTVRITLNTWDIAIMETIGTIFMASPTAIREKGAEWVNEHPVGTGPFVFESWDKSVSVKYRKNENYWQEGKPYLDGVEWKIISDSSTADAALQAKEADMYYSTSARTAKLLERDYEVVKFEAALGSAGPALYPDGGNPDSPWANVKVRQALQYAVDRQALVDTIALGYGIPTNQYAIPGSRFYSDNVKSTYDPDKAKRLLAEAGYAEGFHTVINTPNNPDNVQMYTAVQAMLAQIGIQSEINVVDGAKNQEMTGPNGSWEGLMGYVMRIDNDPPFNMIRNLSSMGTNTRKVAFVEEFDQKLLESRSAPTLDAKAEATRQLQEMAFERYALAVPLYVSYSTTVKEKYVKDDGIHKTWMIFWTPENAWLDK